LPLPFMSFERNAVCISNLSFILCDFTVIIMLGVEYKLWSSSLFSFHQPPYTFSLSGPNILLSILFSNTLDSLNVCAFLDPQSIFFP
jgi:hypothetical protein